MTIKQKTILVKKSMKKDVKEHLKLLQESIFEMIDKSTYEELEEITNNHDPITLVHAVSETLVGGCENCGSCEESCDVEEKKKYDC